MSRIQVKSQTYPERCEVCHQTDLFDPVLNSCSRCLGIAFYGSNEPKLRFKDSRQANLFFYNKYVSSAASSTSEFPDEPNKFLAALPETLFIAAMVLFILFLCAVGFFSWGAKDEA